jgi:DNA repair protein RadC
MNPVIDEAIRILEDSARYNPYIISSPDDTRNFLRLKLANKEHEVFSVMFLDNRHQLIEFEEMFRGTIDGASVYPREVIKRCFELNAAAIIIAHNHPSGITEPSRSDESITLSIKAVCDLMGIRLLDHLIVSKTEATSLAERGVI